MFPACWSLSEGHQWLMPQSHIWADYTIILIEASNDNIFQSWGGSMGFLFAVAYDGVACVNHTEMVTAAQ